MYIVEGIAVTHENHCHIAQYIINTTNLLSSEGSDFLPPAVPYSAFLSGSDYGDMYCFTFTILDDPCVEDNEYFSVHLFTFDSDVIIYVVNARVRIVDHDCK